MNIENMECSVDTSELGSVEEQHLVGSTFCGSTIGMGSTSKLYQDIASLYLNQKFADVSFSLHGQKLYAHKVILAVRSKYFESLLFGSLLEASQSEITLTDVSINVFKKLLEFIYTDRITVVTANLELILNVLDLANKFCINELECVISRKLVELIDANNVCQIMQRAELYNLAELLDICRGFIDEHAWEFLKSEEFTNQPQEVLVQILKRDSFRVPEIEIFKAVAEYYQINGKSSSDLLQCVRLSSLSAEEIYTVVEPSQLLTDNVLIKAIAEIIGIAPKTSTSRCVSLLNRNVASLEDKAQVLDTQNNLTDLNFLLNGNSCDDRFASYPIGGTQGFTVKLKAPAYINCIHLLLRVGPDRRSYSYYVESSVDGKSWKRVIDYTDYKGRALQKLYFEKELMQFVKVIGTHSPANTFEIVSFEAYFKDTIPKCVNGVICPRSNVALLTKNAVLVQGIGNEILSGQANFRNSTCHYIGRDSILVQLAQPYFVDRIKLVLDDSRGNYRYYVETSVNKVDWTMIADRSSNEYCRSWQDLHFAARPVVFIKITGTSSSQGYEFYCSRIECFASEELRKAI